MWAPTNIIRMGRTQIENAYGPVKNQFSWMDCQAEPDELSLS